MEGSQVSTSETTVGHGRTSDNKTGQKKTQHHTLTEDTHLKDTTSEDCRTMNLVEPIPEEDDLLTLPPHCSNWLDTEITHQLQELEKDVQALLIDQNVDTYSTNHLSSSWQAYQGTSGMAILRLYMTHQSNWETTWPPGLETTSIYVPGREPTMLWSNFKRISQHISGYHFHGDRPG